MVCAYLTFNSWGGSSKLSSVLAAYHLELIVSATLSLLAVVAVRFREATPESIAHAPPMLRTAIVSFFAVLGSILALRDLDEVAGGLAVTALAALALANFVLSRRPLISAAFVSAFLKAFLGCLLIWWVVAVAIYFCGDTHLQVHGSALCLDEVCDAMRYVP